MLKIRKDDKVLEVTKGAFREVYGPSGWVIDNGIPDMPSLEPAVAPGGMGGSNHTDEQEEATGGSVEPSEEETLSHMSEMELKQYASLLGVKTKGLKTKKELMEAIMVHKG